jgi:hypothetical protein
VRAITVKRFSISKRPLNGNEVLGTGDSGSRQNQYRKAKPKRTKQIPRSHLLASAVPMAKSSQPDSHCGGAGIG